jgi:hypothetical protein
LQRCPVSSLQRIARGGNLPTLGADIAQEHVAMEANKAAHYLAVML